MIISDCTQGDDKWVETRIGRPSSSRFAEILTPTGKPSKQAEKYLFELAGERLIGMKPQGYQSAVMQRGIELESEARQFYEMINDIEVEQIGCFLPDDRKLWVSSPDGLVGDSGLLEIKCPVLSTAIGYLIDQKVPTKYIPQIQGQMLTSGRQWVDFLSYYPGLTPLIVRVTRDDKFCAALKVELDEFCIRLDDIESKLKSL